MIPLWIVRALRAFGWLCLGGSIGVALFEIAAQSLAGPPPDVAVWPSPRLWSAFGQSLGIAAATSGLSLLFAILPAIGLVASFGTARRAIVGLTTIPLVTMPGIFGYGWMLLATSRTGGGDTVLCKLGWNDMPVELHAAWALANWLWPLPTLLIATAFEQTGRAGYQLARLDAGPLRALYRGALPAMKAPLVAAIAATLVFALTESTVAPLLSATEIWGAEMKAAAQIALQDARPVGSLAWQSWPMLVTVVLMMAIAWPGLRTICAAADSAEPLGHDRGTCANRSWLIASLATAVLSLLPMGVFSAELASSGASLWASLKTAHQTMGRDMKATLLMAVISLAAFGSVAVAMVGDFDKRPLRRIFCVGAMAALIAGAILPPELIGTALVSFYVRVGRPDGFNVYDHTPCVWVAAMICRYGFLPAGAAWLMNRKLPTDTLNQAEAEGAGPMQQIAYVRLPLIWRTIVAASAVAGCLAISEVAASVIVAPAQFIGGPLSVQVDAQMHYGRQNETVALSLLLMAPAVLAAWLLPTVARKVRSVKWTQARQATIAVIFFFVLVACPSGCDSRPPDAKVVKLAFGKPGLSPGEFSYPRALAVSPVDQRVFVIDKSARVQRFSPDGAYETGWRMPEFKNGKPTGLTVDRENHVWIADTHYARVIVYDRGGHEIKRFGSYGEGPGQFVFPTAVAFDKEGFVYVGEYGGNDRISKFTADGKYLSSFADRNSGNASIERPTGLVFDQDDMLWLADACHHRICRYDRTGKLLSSFGTPGTEPGQLNYPYGLALEPGGTLLVADRGNNRIVRFDRSGRYVGSWGAPGRALGQIAQPWSVAIAAGRIYCLDSWNNRVQVIDW